MSRIAVVGAGLSGLVVARALAGGHDVRLFDKSRAAGGRMATRRRGPWHFDHGAQFFTARTAAFRRFLAPLIDDGVVSTWHARFAEFRDGERAAARSWTASYPHYVGVPGMSAVGRWLARGLDVDTSFHVHRLEKTAAGWLVSDAGQRQAGPFDWVVLSVPAPQAGALLPADSPLANVARRHRMKACVALLVGLERDPGLDFDAARIRGAEISWISANHSKPGRPDAPALVVHSTNAWADAHIEEDVRKLRETLMRAACDIAGPALRDAAHIDLHRWRYANADKLRERPPQIDADNGLALCGDWLVRGRVEAAFTSARRLLDRLSGAIPIETRRQ